MRHFLRRPRPVVGIPFAGAALLVPTALASPASAAGATTAIATATSRGGCRPTATQLPDPGYSDPVNHIAGFPGGMNGDTSPVG
jgi:hypothetical protein